MTKAIDLCQAMNQGLSSLRLSPEARQQVRSRAYGRARNRPKSQFLKLNSTHIEYVLSSFKENASKVRNIKQYLLASLYNAPLTISNYYDALVRHDMANGFV